MKIGIVTVYNSLNYGSFAQANALRVVLSDYGEVFFIKTGIRSMWKKSFKFMTIKLIKFHFRGFLFEWTKFLSCYKNIRNFKTAAMNKKGLKNVNLIVFGSDELWNIERKEFKFLFLWGKGFENYNKISYAVSMNNSTERSLYENCSPHVYLKTFKTLSARDKHSQGIIGKLTGRKISLVLDPTLLLEPQTYMSMIPKICLSDYIAVYVFKISEDMIDIVCRIAVKRGKKLVSLAAWWDWCDRNIAVTNPFAYFSNADFVITSTFHGTAFAINFKKQFIVFTNDNIKVKELLEEFDLSDRIADGFSEKAVMDLINKKIDYSSVEKILASKRQKSLKYLRSAIS